MAFSEKYAKPSAGNTMLRIAFLLLILLLVSVYFVGGLLARYNATGSGEDDARVAKFDVQITGDAKDTVIAASVDPDTGLYEIKVENDSEVAVHYEISVSITPTGGLFPASAISCTVKHGDLESDSGDLPAGPDATAIHTVIFSVNDWNAITQTMSGNQGEVSFAVTATVHVTQID